MGEAADSVRLEWSTTYHFWFWAANTLSPLSISPKHSLGEGERNKEKKGNQPLQIGPVKPWRPENTDIQTEIMANYNHSRESQGREHSVSLVQHLSL